MRYAILGCVVGGLALAKNVCIAIAVARPADLDELPGAIPSATRFAAWAVSQGYDTKLVTDEVEPVTCERLARIFRDKLGAGGQGRLIVSFAGHGLTRGAGEEYWLLNDWRRRPTEAVNHLKLRDRLGTYLPKQLAIVSDACRSLATERAKWVEGTGVVDVMDYVEQSGQVVHLAGTRSAQPALQTPLGMEEAYCFFTHVLTNALLGIPEGVAEIDAEGRRVITSDRLIDTVEQELPRLASRYQRRQIPDLQGTWRAPKNVWSVLSDDAPAPVEPLLPAPERKAMDRAFRAAPGPAEVAAVAEAKVERFADQLAAEARQSPFEARTGVVVYGDQAIEDLAVAPGFSAVRDPMRRNQFELRTGARGATPLAAQLSNGDWVAAAAYDGFIGAFSLGEDGADSYVLRRAGQRQQRDRALGRAATGGVADLFELAALLRDEKHMDPVLGALAAYAYARAGAIDDIRRLCHFYVELQQPIPFDAVLLARAPVARGPQGWIANIPSAPARTPRNAAEERRGFTHYATAGGRGPVAGGFPWLRQGWALLEDDFRPEFRALKRYAGALRPSVFTTLQPAAGADLAAAIRAGQI